MTEVGVIPEDWIADCLGSYVEIKSGESPSLFRFKAEGTPFFKVEQLNNSDKFISDTIYFFQGSKSVPKNSLIFPKRGASILLNKIRILAQDSFMDTNLMSLTVKETLDSEFLYYALHYVELWRIADTTSIPQINNKHILPLVLPLPPTLTEQAAIAEALSDADALIESLEQLIAKKRQIKQGAMQELLTGKRRLPGFEGDGKRGYQQTEVGEIPEDWEVRTYGEVFTFLNTATYSRAELNELDGVGYIHYGDIHTKWNYHLDIQNEILPCISNNKLKNYSLLKDGDVVMADASEDYSGIGKSVEVLNIKEKSVISGLHTFLFRDLSGVFTNGYKGYLHSISQVKAQFDSLATGMKVYGVSKTNLKKVFLHVPPKAEQQAIVKVLLNMDTEIESLESKLSKSRQIKKGMMQELLTGRIRLV